MICIFRYFLHNRLYRLSQTDISYHAQYPYNSSFYGTSTSIGATFLGVIVCFGANGVTSPPKSICVVRGGWALHRIEKIRGVAAARQLSRVSMVQLLTRQNETRLQVSHVRCNRVLGGD